mmetsp:Transcript_9250/g.10551  ORF Transcript_9250/g.10551 Transcript_9250/m.10551 type:complete len:100 (+) Transcript_9250:90-389(+)
MLRSAAGSAIPQNERLSLFENEKENLEMQIKACCEVDESLEQLPKSLRKKVMVPLGQVSDEIKTFLYVYNSVNTSKGILFMTVNRSLLDGVCTWYCGTN